MNIELVFKNLAVSNAMREAFEKESSKVYNLNPSMSVKGLVEKTSDSDNPYDLRIHLSGDGHNVVVTESGKDAYSLIKKAFKKLNAKILKNK